MLFLKVKNRSAELDGTFISYVLPVHPSLYLLLGDVIDNFGR
jgi:hypothetical protein